MYQNQQRFLRLLLRGGRVTGCPGVWALLLVHAMSHSSESSAQLTGDWCGRHDNDPQNSVNMEPV
jgi:hypothetical protein